MMASNKPNTHQKTKPTLILIFTGTQLAAAALAGDDITNRNEMEIETLRQQIQGLEQKVDVLEHQQQQEHEAATNTAGAPARLIIGANGVNFVSGDSNVAVSLHGWLQVDNRTFFQSGGAPGIDGFLLRRARPILQGTLFQNYDFNFTPEFAGSAPQILDAYVNYRYSPELQLEAGKFKPPIGLEALQPDIYTFFNERSLATDLVPYRDIGLELHGDLFGRALSYAAAVLNGAPDYNTTTVNANYDNNVAFAGRVFTMPFTHTSFSLLEGLGFGVSGSYENDQSTTSGLTPGFTTDGQQKFFAYTNGVAANGAHWRISPQGYYYCGPLGLIGEYVISDQRVTQTTAPVASADLRNTAWEASGGWVLTGENDSYNGVTPRHPLNIRNGSWGAWQLVLRYEELDVDHAAFPEFASPQTSASQAHAWSAGLNWYLNSDLRANVSFSRTTFAGGAGGAVTKQPEEVLFTRVQLAF